MCVGSTLLREVTEADLDRVLAIRTAPGVNRFMLHTDVDPDEFRREWLAVPMRLEQHGIEDSWHAELGWIDGYTFGLLDREWRAQNAQPADTSR